MREQDPVIASTRTTRLGMVYPRGQGKGHRKGVRVSPAEGRLRVGDAESTKSVPKGDLSTRSRATLNCGQGSL